MKTIKGDLVKLTKRGEFDFMIHGCNCFHTMGSGIAAQVKKEFPSAFDADLETEKGSFLKLGSFSMAKDINDLNQPAYIINAYTQYRYGIDDGPYDKFVHVDYTAIRLFFRTLVSDMKIFTHDQKKIGFPMIGAGLAGGDWDIIKKIIEEETAFSNHEWILVEYEN